MTEYHLHSTQPYYLLGKGNFETGILWYVLGNGLELTDASIAYATYASAEAAAITLLMQDKLHD